MERSGPWSRYQRNPVAFFNEILGIETWSRQTEICEAVRDHDRVAVASGHRVSKSCTAAGLGLWFLHSFEDARVIMTCVTARQVDDVLYREVRKLHARSGFCVACRAENERREGTGRQPIPRPCPHSRVLEGEPRELARNGIKLPDFRQLFGFTAKEPEAAAGVAGRNMLFIVDEASGVPDSIFTALEGNRAGGARLALFGNPTQNEGEFFEAFGSKSRFYKTLRISSEESPNVVANRDVVPGLATREWIEEKRLEWGEASALFKVRVKGEFVRIEEGKIISLHLLELAEQRWADTPAVGRLWVGVDPAGPGEKSIPDEAAFSARRGLKQIAAEVHHRLEAEALVVHLLAFLSVHRVQREVPVVVLDAEGPIGIKVSRLLRDHLDQYPRDFELVLVLSSQDAVREPAIYDTLRDDLWANASRWLRDGGALLEDVKQTRDLHSPSWTSVRKRGRTLFKATDKRELRKMLGRSPDRGDAFCLSVWEPAHLEETPLGAMPSQAAADMDPYEEDTSRALSPYGGSF